MRVKMHAAKHAFRGATTASGGLMVAPGFKAPTRRNDFCRDTLIRRFDFFKMLKSNGRLCSRRFALTLLQKPPRPQGPPAAGPQQRDT